MGVSWARSGQPRGSLVYVQEGRGVRAGEKSAHHRGSFLRCGAAPRAGSGQERGPSFAANRCTSVVLLLGPVELSSGLRGAVSTLKTKHLRLDRVMWPRRALGSNREGRAGRHKPPVGVHQDADPSCLHEGVALGCGEELWGPSGSLWLHLLEEAVQPGAKPLGCPQ